MNVLEIVGALQDKGLIRKPSYMSFKLSYVGETKPSLEFLRTDD
jgi:hypothetical protein